MLPGSRSNEKQILASIAIISIFADTRIIQDYSEAQNRKKFRKFLKLRNKYDYNNRVHSNINTKTFQFQDIFILFRFRCWVWFPNEIR